MVLKLAGAIVLLLLVGAAAVAIVFRAKGRASRRPATKPLGMIDGRLWECPSTPNCVVSEGPADERHAIPPLAAGATLQSTQQALRLAIAGASSELGVPARVVADEPGYLRAEFTSRLFGFVDDLELRIDMPAKAVQVRSASRVGRSDFGANRKRVEVLRRRLAEELAR